MLQVLDLDFDHEFKTFDSSGDFDWFRMIIYIS
jgi:hypothetical protein